ncbi:MAG: type 4a pilus biogenesis protein PilO [Bacteroidetes bacterium]|nr:type 4a pilus biogenesis protein PilO [Bacteroidota bacterium]
MKRPYLVLACLSAFLFVYLLAVDVTGRFEATWKLYSNLTEKNKALLDPSSLAAKKMFLLAERDSLSARIITPNVEYAQNEISVVELVARDARKAKVIVISLSPGNEARSGQITEIGFNIRVIGGFYQIGKFINLLENERMPLKISRLRIVTNPIGTAHLVTTIKGTAFLYNGCR